MGKGGRKDLGCGRPKNLGSLFSQNAGALTTESKTHTFQAWKEHTAEQFCSVALYCWTAFICSKMSVMQRWIGGGGGIARYSLSLKDEIPAPKNQSLLVQAQDLQNHCKVLSTEDTFWKDARFKVLIAFLSYGEQVQWEKGRTVFPIANFLSYVCVTGLYPGCHPKTFSCNGRNR